MTAAALRKAARTTTAVPCWSSWNTGIDSLARSRASTSKQRGAEMSSRLIPPKDGAMRSTVSTISSTSVVSRTIGTALRPANSLNSAALPSITGSAAAGPMLPRPEHRRAVADDRDQTRAPGVARASYSSSAMAVHTSATPGV